LIRPTQPGWLSPLCIVHALWYLDCTDLSTYFAYLLIVKQVYNGSVINEVFSSCIVYILGYFGCTDTYQERVVVNKYNKSDYIPNAIKIISHPFILNVNKYILSGYLEV